MKVLAFDGQVFYPAIAKRVNLTIPDEIVYVTLTIVDLAILCLIYFRPDLIVIP